MGIPRFTPEFKEEAVRQITERALSVADVSERIGVSAHSLYKWIRSVKPNNCQHHAQDLLEVRTEIIRLKSHLKRTEEERHILKKAARYFARGRDLSTALSAIIVKSGRSLRCIGF